VVKADDRRRAADAHGGTLLATHREPPGHLSRPLERGDAVARPDVFDGPVRPVGHQDRRAPGHAFQVVGPALVPLLGLLVGAAPEFDGPPARQVAPRLRRAVELALLPDQVEGLLHQFLQLRRLLAEDERLAVLRGGQAEEQKTFSPSGRASVEEFVSLGVEGQRLRPRVRPPRNRRLPHQLPGLLRKQPQQVPRELLGQTRVGGTQVTAPGGSFP